MSSAPRVKNRSIPGLLIYAITGEVGDAWYLSIPKDTAAEELRAVAVYTAGAASVDRVSGTPGPFYTGPTSVAAGDFSPERHLPLMPAGRLKYTVTAAPFQYFCLIDPQHRDLHPRLHRGRGAAPLECTPGTRLFIARGALTVGPDCYTAPLALKVTSAGKQATLSEDALVVELDLLP